MSAYAYLKIQYQFEFVCMPGIFMVNFIQIMNKNK